MTPVEREMEAAIALSVPHSEYLLLDKDDRLLLEEYLHLQRLKEADLDRRRIRAREAAEKDTEAKRKLYANAPHASSGRSARGSIKR